MRGSWCPQPDPIEQVGLRALCRRRRRIELGIVLVDILCQLRNDFLVLRYVPSELLLVQSNKLQECGRQRERGGLSGMGLDALRELEFPVPASEIPSGSGPKGSAGCAMASIMERVGKCCWL